MATRQASGSVSIGWMAVWAVLIAACAWFLLDSYIYAVTRDQQDGTTLWNRLAWYAAHVAVASPILVIAPLQFLPGLRARAPRLHRWLGRVFLGACLLAAPLGVWLGVTIDNPGSRVPLVLRGLRGSSFRASPGRPRASGISSIIASSSFAASRWRSPSCGYACFP